MASRAVLSSADDNDTSEDDRQTPVPPSRVGAGKGTGGKYDRYLASVHPDFPEIQAFETVEIAHCYGAQRAAAPEKLPVTERGVKKASTTAFELHRRRGIAGGVWMVTPYRPGTSGEDARDADDGRTAASHVQPGARVPEAGRASEQAQPPASVQSESAMAGGGDIEAASHAGVPTAVSLTPSLDAMATRSEVFATNVNPPPAASVGPQTARANAPEAFAPTRLAIPAVPLRAVTPNAVPPIGNGTPVARAQATAVQAGRKSAPGTRAPDEPASASPRAWAALAPQSTAGTTPTETTSASPRAWVAPAPQKTGGSLKTALPPIAALLRPPDAANRPQPAPPVAGMKRREPESGVRHDAGDGRASLTLATDDAAGPANQRLAAHSRSPAAGSGRIVLGMNARAGHDFSRSQHQLPVGPSVQPQAPSKLSKSAVASAGQKRREPERGAPDRATDADRTLTGAVTDAATSVLHPPDRQALPPQAWTMTSLADAMSQVGFEQDVPSTATRKDPERGAPKHVRFAPEPGETPGDKHASTAAFCQTAETHGAVAAAGTQLHNGTTTPPSVDAFDVGYLEDAGSQAATSETSLREVMDALQDHLRAVQSCTVADCTACAANAGNDSATLLHQSTDPTELAVSTCSLEDLALLRCIKSDLRRMSRWQIKQACSAVVSAPPWLNRVRRLQLAMCSHMMDTSSTVRAARDGSTCEPLLNAFAALSEDARISMAMQQGRNCAVEIAEHRLGLLAKMAESQQLRIGCDAPEQVVQACRHECTSLAALSASCVAEVYLTPLPRSTVLDRLDNEPSVRHLPDVKAFLDAALAAADEIVGVS